MRILFIFPNIDYGGYKLVGVSTLSALARNAGHETALFDTSFYKTSNLSHNRNFEEGKTIGERILDFKPVDNYNVHGKQEVDVKQLLLDKLKSFKPDVVGVSCLSTEWFLSQYLLSLVKEYDKKIFTIVGGRHCVADPTGTIQHPAVDAICSSEGEYPFVRLLDVLSKGSMDYSIPGLWMKDDRGQIHKNPGVDYYRNLDELPYIDNSIYDDRQLYRAFYGRLWRSLDFNLMRGCNEHCSYCQMHRVYELHGGDTTIRRYSVERAVDEFAWQKQRHNLEFIRFHDESFLIISAQYLAELSKAYTERVGLPFCVDASPLTVSEERARLLAEMGCKSISLGFESGNEDFRMNNLNKRVTSQRALKSFQLLADVGLRTVAFNLIGFPHETRELIFDTVEFMRHARVHSPSIGFVYPFKGTTLRDKVISEGLFDPAIEEYGTAQWGRGSPVIRNPSIGVPEYLGMFRTFILYCKLPKRYWGDLRIAEKDTDQGNRMFQQYKDIYNTEYRDKSCGDDERVKYVPGIERELFHPREASLDSAFPHST